MYTGRSTSRAHAEPNRRATSGFVRDSSFTTSAPWKASARPQLGAAMAIDSSTTDTSSKTPTVPPKWSPNRRKHATNPRRRADAGLSASRRRRARRFSMAWRKGRAPGPGLDLVRAAARPAGAAPRARRGSPSTAPSATRPALSSPRTGPPTASVMVRTSSTAVSSRSTTWTSSPSSRTSIWRAAACSGVTSVVPSMPSSSILAAMASASTPRAASTSAARRVVGPGQRFEQVLAAHRRAGGQLLGVGDRLLGARRAAGRRLAPPAPARRDLAPARRPGPGRASRPAAPAPGRRRPRPRARGRGGCARCRCSCGRAASASRSDSSSTFLARGVNGMCPAGGSVAPADQALHVGADAAEARCRAGAAPRRPRPRPRGAGRAGGARCR